MSTTNPTKDASLARALSLTARASEATRTADERMRERDDAIRQAISHGVGVRELARASGMTAARISQICSR